jgi:translation elongation factor EF-1alpha
MLTPSFRHIPIGGAAIVQLRLTNKRGIPIEPFEVNRNLGRVVLRSEGVTVGAGNSYSENSAYSNRHCHALLIACCERV